MTHIVGWTMHHIKSLSLKHDIINMCWTWCLTENIIYTQKTWESFQRENISKNVVIDHERILKLNKYIYPCAVKWEKSILVQNKSRSITSLTLFNKVRISWKFWLLWMLTSATSSHVDLVKHFCFSWMVFD